MNIQSLSVIVPTRGCPLNCKFCVSKTHGDVKYENRFEEDKDEYFNRLQFARNNGVNTVVITADDGEALTNRVFLEDFRLMNEQLKPTPFLWVELQTSGVMLTDSHLSFLKYKLGVSTISLSVSDLFDDANNWRIMDMPSKLQFNLAGLCKTIKKYGFNLRMSLNMTDAYHGLGRHVAHDIFGTLIRLGVDQVTFRQLYQSNNDYPQDRWVSKHRAHANVFNHIDEYIKMEGRALNKLPFGFRRYAVNGISTIIDEDCMSTILDTTLRYLILREDCKLYTDWQDKGSLLF